MSTFDFVGQSYEEFLYLPNFISYFSFFFISFYNANDYMHSASRGFESLLAQINAQNKGCQKESRFCSFWKIWCDNVVGKWPGEKKVVSLHQQKRTKWFG